MGEAYNHDGELLGTATGFTKAEVLKKLEAAHGVDVAEVRIRTLERQHVKTLGGVQVEMPRYQSHKVVHAIKIASVTLDWDVAAAAGRDTDGSAILHPEDPTYAPFRVDAAFVRKHSPAGSFYYVVYLPDGYASLSPIEAFENGYTRL